MRSYTDFSGTLPSYLNSPEVAEENALRLRKSIDKYGSVTNTVQPDQGTMLPNAIANLRSRSNRAYEQASQLAEQPIDYTGLQDFARQRGKQGEQAMLNALAAQYAGENFAPLQQQFMKTAAGAQEPIKVGGGLITARGGFVKDPEAAQEKQIQRLMSDARYYEQLATNAETQEQKRAAQAAQNAITNQLSVMGLNLRQQSLNQQADNQRLAQSFRDEGRRLQRDRDREQQQRQVESSEDKLRAEYTKRAEKVREGTGHAQNVLQQLLDPRIKTDATRQVALIFSFGKMLDPESVVRESEYALIANARGFLDQLQQLIPRLQTGARLSPEQLKSMQEVAANLMQGASTRIEDLNSYYYDLATRRNLNPINIMPSSTRGSDGRTIIDFNSLPKN